MGLLKSMFGPSKDEIWSQISKDIGGEYIDGGFWRKDELRYAFGEWEILLDTFTVNTGKASITYTRMRAPFINKDGLQFKIYREGLFSTIAKKFGMQDIVIGDPAFDEKFIIKGNNEEKIMMLLAEEQLKYLINQQPKISYEIRDDEGRFKQKFPEGVDELYFQCVGIIKDKKLLKNLFYLFAVTLDRLTQIDSAYESDPGIKLK